MAECSKCGIRGCKYKCDHCGQPYCSEPCMNAVCGRYYDENYVGIDISPDKLATIVKPESERRLTPKDFEGGRIRRNIHPEEILQHDVIDVMPEKYRDKIEIYGAHVSELGTGSKIFSKLTARLAPIHVENYQGKVIFLLISTVSKDKFVPKSGDAKANTATYEKALKHIQDHNEIVRQLILLDAKKAVPEAFAKQK